MASKIQIKRTKTPGNKPTTTQLQEGELALNLPDKKIFTNDGTNIIELGGSIDYASDAEVLAGTVTDKVISPAGLDYIFVDDEREVTVGGTNPDFATLQDFLDYAQRCIFTSSGMIIVVLRDGIHKIGTKPKTYEWDNVAASFQNANIYFHSESWYSGNCTITLDRTAPRNITRFFALYSGRFAISGVTFSPNADGWTSNLPYDKKDATKGMMKPVGVYSYGANVDDVADCVFENLHTGIYVDGSNLFRVQSNTFKNCDICFNIIRCAPTTFPANESITIDGSPSGWPRTTEIFSLKDQFLNIALDLKVNTFTLASATATRKNGINLINGASVTNYVTGEKTRFNTNDKTIEYYDNTKAFFSVGDSSIVRNLFVTKKFEPIDTPTATPADDAKALVALNATGKIDSGFLPPSAISYASDDEVAAGTVTDKVISPKGLRSIIIDSPVTKTVGTTAGNDFATLDAAIQWAQKCIFSPGGHLYLTLDAETHVVHANAHDPDYWGESIASFSDATISILNYSSSPAVIQPDPGVTGLNQVFLLSNCWYDIEGVILDCSKIKNKSGLLSGIVANNSFRGDLDIGLKSMTIGMIISGGSFLDCVPFTRGIEDIDEAAMRLVSVNTLYNPFGNKTVVKGTVGSFIHLEKGSNLFISENDKLTRADSFDIKPGGTLHTVIAKSRSKPKNATEELLKTGVPFYSVIDTMNSISGFVYDGNAGNKFEPIDTPTATPANDAQALVALNATGKIDEGFFDIDGGTY